MNTTPPAPRTIIEHFIGTNYPKPKYLQTVGKFIDAFAVAESHLHDAFHMFLGVDKAVGAAIKGGMRTGDLMAMTKAVATARGLEKKRLEELKVLFAHFTPISILRDRIVHRGAMPFKYVRGSYIATNISTVRASENFEIFRFTLQDVRNATTDLAYFIARLAECAAPGVLKKIPLQLSGHRRLRRPWRYKPVQPETPNQRIQKKRGTR